MGTCAWPECKNEALCSSGNFFNLLVCKKHFSITNGTNSINVTWRNILDIILLYRNLENNLRIEIYEEEIEKYKTKIEDYKHRFEAS